MSKINVYTCRVGHATITRDTEPRVVTPMTIRCPVCRMNAVSAGYNCPQDLEPNYEWFVPKTAEEMKEACLPLYGDVFSDDDYKSMLNASVMYRKIRTDGT